jgi:hypothetical protein
VGAPMDDSAHGLRMANRVTLAQQLLKHESQNNGYFESICFRVADLNIHAYRIGDRALYARQSIIWVVSLRGVVFCSHRPQASGIRKTHGRGKPSLFLRREGVEL